jgi:glycosyltransferase involved in cell wall biosynthesis
MKVAFFAPLKPPNHPVPSGDRAMARAVMAAFAHGGISATLGSELRLYDGQGEKAAQAALTEAAQAETARLLADPVARDWQAWVSYHNYYKAPDLIGPPVSRALGIPYYQIESTRARKRLVGPWAGFAAAAEAASDAADTIFYFTHRDAETLRRDAPAGQALIHLPPFLARADLPPQSARTGPMAGPMLSVGMMRRGDKLASYQLIADTLALLPGTLDWSLNIAGDGQARPEVARMMAPFHPRVTFLGTLETDDLAQVYGNASLLFWPGVNEAFGLVYLEAQAAGLPVVAQDRPGVRDVIWGHHPAPRLGPEAMAHQIIQLLSDPRARDQAGRAARQMVQRSHLLGSAAATLKTALEGAVA